MTFEDWWNKYCLTCAGMDKDAHEQMWERAQQIEREECAKLIEGACFPNALLAKAASSAIRERGNK